MSVAFEVLDDLADLCLSIRYFIGLPGDLDLRASGKDLEKRELSFKEFEFAVVDPEELYGIHCFEVDDCYCQCATFYGLKIKLQKAYQTEIMVLLSLLKLCRPRGMR